MAKKVITKKYANGGPVGPPRAYKKEGAESPTYAKYGGIMRKKYDKGGEVKPKPKPKKKSFDKTQYVKDVGEEVGIGVALQYLDPTQMIDFGRDMYNTSEALGKGRPLSALANFVGSMLPLTGASIEDAVEPFLGEYDDKLQKIIQKKASKTLNRNVNQSNAVRKVAVGSWATGGKVRKEYALGSPVPEDPSIAITRNQIAQAKAAQTAANDPTAKGLNMFGNLAMSVGQQMMQKGISEGGGADGKGIAGFLNKNQGTMNTMFGAMQGIGAGASFALGGVAKTKRTKFANGGVPINAEGGEVVEVPGGEPVELDGASHANGGINMEVPAGTEIYSQQLKGPDGRTMAARKKSREGKEAKLGKTLQVAPTDKLLRNAYKRTKQANAVVDAQDMNKMKIAQMITQMGETYAMGGTVQRYDLGGEAYEEDFIDPPTKHRFGAISPEAIAQETAQRQNLLNQIGKSKRSGYNISLPNTYRRVPIIPGSLTQEEKYRQDLLAKFGGNSKPNKNAGFVAKTPPTSVVQNQNVPYTKKVSPINKQSKVQPTYTKKTKYSTPNSTPISPQGITPLSGVTEMHAAGLTNTGFDSPTASGQINTPYVGDDTTIEPSGFDFGSILGNVTAGDALGLYGQYKASTDPLKNTRAQRASDTPNINAFKDYGKRGLNELDKSKGYLEGQRASALGNLNLDRVAASSRNRAGARGINTLRSLDIATDVQAQKAKESVNNQFNSMMAGIFDKASGMMNQQDQMVMQGEQGRDAADRADKDAYYSAMARDIATKNTGMQYIGKNINEMKTRKVTNTLMNKLYPNFKVDGMSGDVTKGGITIAKAGTWELVDGVLRDKKTKKEIKDTE